MRAPHEPVTFPNREGLRLFGILSRPATDAGTRTGVILLSPGVKSRVAPHRLYNKVAAALVELGMPVLRFDFYGLGDSEGTLGEDLLADLYGAIQMGRYADDTRAAVAWMREHCGVDRCLLVGLCGGGITGVLAAAGGVEHIAGIVAFGLPVILDGSHIDKVSTMTVGQLNSIRGKYLRKLLDPQAWLRVLSFKTDFRLLLRALGIRRASEGTSSPAASTSPATPPAARSDVNPLFGPAFLRLLEQRRPVILIFSEADRLYWEYREKFWDANRQHLDGCAWLETVVVTDANHIFTFREWQQQLMAICTDWIRRHVEGLPPGRMASIPVGPSIAMSSEEMPARAPEPA